jgi:hypothetical protein
LELAGPADGADAGAFLARVVGLDRDAVVRLQHSAGGVVLWAWLPVDVLVSRRIGGTLGPADVTVPGADLLARIGSPAASSAGEVTLPPAVDGRWRGTLPGPAGWRLLDAVPAAAVLSLVRAGAAAFRAATPGGAAASRVADALLSHESLTVSAGDLTVGVPLRGLQSLARMGFVAPAGEVAVSARPAWLRLDADYGSAYLRRGAELTMQPV